MSATLFPLSSNGDGDVVDAAATAAHNNTQHTQPLPPTARKLDYDASDGGDELLEQKMQALYLGTPEQQPSSPPALPTPQQQHQQQPPPHEQEQQPQRQQQQANEEQEQALLQAEQLHLRHGDGSDSGVEIASTVGGAQLQRALSSNSGGYASSSNGALDDTCDSSIVSVGSLADLAEPALLRTAHAVGGRSTDGCSENGSESSSIPATATTPTSAAAMPGSAASRRTTGGSSVRRRVAMFESSSQESQASAPAIAAVTPTRRTGEPRERGSENSMANYKTPISHQQQQQQQQPQVQQQQQQHHSISQLRPRLSGLKRTASLPRPTAAALQVRERAALNASRNTVGGSTYPAATTPSRVTATARNAAAGRQQPPDSLGGNSALSRTQSMSMQRLVQRTPSLSHARTPGTPSDDGRWPSIGSAASMRLSSASSGAAAGRRGLSMTPDLATAKARASLMTASMDCRQLGVNPYSTLPRRRKQKSVEDLTERGGRSVSISRDGRLSVAATVTPTSTRRSIASGGKMAPPPPPLSSMSAPLSGKQSSLSSNRRAAAASAGTKTRIYHETSVQTALTCADVEQALAGIGITSTRPIDAAEQRDQQTQSDLRDRELERLRDEVRQLMQREHEFSAKLKREREEKLAMQRELHLNTERVMAMLEMARLAGGMRSAEGAGTPNSDDDSGGHDSLLMLESQIQLSGHELLERQNEIGQLRQMCRSLQLEMQRSLSAQECLLQEKAAIEQESSELHDFLQHEKAAMCDALKELEADYTSCQQTLASRDEEIKVLRDECRHLVRLNEQRRQENRMLQTNYAALEVKSKEFLLQQNATAAGASSALNGLHSRLDNLVEQLVTSYNISEQDLEDLGFQNDAQQPNGTSGSSNGLDLPLYQQNQQHLQQQQQLQQCACNDLSPQRNQSFIAAVISAIRNATNSSSHKRQSMRTLGGSGHKRVASNSHMHNGNSSHNQNGNSNNNTSIINNREHMSNNDDESDSTEMLDSETEPCLMMDNVLEDVAMPDSHSHNMVSSSCAAGNMISQIELPSDLLLNSTTGDESLRNLSEAIANRQEAEMQINALHKVSAMQLNGQHEFNSLSEDIVSCHDSLADMPSLMEYSTMQALVDQVIEVDSLITKLLKVLRLIQLDNDQCIQQLIVDKNKLQENKEDMLEKLKDLQDVNMKLQDDLMDATQELMLKNSDLANSKAEIQRHRNEIDRLTEDVCNLSTLCSNYRKLSPTTELPPPPQLLTPDTPDAGDSDSETIGILNLLKMWHAEGQLKDARVRQFLRQLYSKQDSNSNNAPENSERLRIYANQLENVLRVLAECADEQQDNQHQQQENDTDDYASSLQQLRKDIEIVKVNANWAHLLADTTGGGNANNNGAGDDNATDDKGIVEQDVNANAEPNLTIDAAVKIANGNLEHCTIVEAN